MRGQGLPIGSAPAADRATSVQGRDARERIIYLGGSRRYVGLQPLPHTQYPEVEGWVRFRSILERDPPLLRVRVLRLVTQCSKHNSAHGFVLQGIPVTRMPGSRAPGTLLDLLPLQHSAPTHAAVLHHQRLRGRVATSSAASPRCLGLTAS